MQAAAQKALGSDIRLLGDLLGHAIRRLAGEDAFRLEEEVRAATKELRANTSVEEARRLRDRLGRLDRPPPKRVPQHDHSQRALAGDAADRA